MLDKVILRGVVFKATLYKQAGVNSERKIKRKTIGYTIKKWLTVCRWHHSTDAVIFFNGIW